MGRIVNFLNNRYIIAIIVALFLIGVSRRFVAR